MFSVKAFALYPLQWHTDSLQGLHHRVAKPAWTTNQYILIFSKLAPVIDRDASFMHEQLLVSSLWQTNIWDFHARKDIYPD